MKKGKRRKLTKEKADAVNRKRDLVQGEGTLECPRDRVEPRPALAAVKGPTIEDLYEFLARGQAAQRAIDKLVPEVAPHLVNPLPKNVVLTGGLIPWHDDQPVLLRMPLSDLDYFPVFSSKELLEDTLGKAGIPFTSIKQVENGPEFLTTFTEEHRRTMKLIFDPFFMSTGRIRFTQVLWPE